MHIFKAEVLSHFKEAIRKDISSLKSELKSLRKRESKKSEKQRTCRVERQVNKLKQALAKVEKKSASSLSTLTKIVMQPIVFSSFLIKNVGNMQRESFIVWIKFLLLCCCIAILDHRSFKDGMFFQNYFY